MEQLAAGSAGCSELEVACRHFLPNHPHPRYASRPQGVCCEGSDSYFGLILELNLYKHS